VAESQHHKAPTDACYPSQMHHRRKTAPQATSLRQSLLADTDPKWRDSYTQTMFAGFERLIYLQQEPNEALERKAEEIAQSVGLPLEVQSVGLGALEDRLVAAVEGSRET
jgi:hypothetical protein